MTWEIGIVRAWFESRGFGFLRSQKERSIFIHRTVLTDGREALSVGDLIEFQCVTLEVSPRGPRAVRARRLRKTECPKCSRLLIDLTCSCGFSVGILTETT